MKLDDDRLEMIRRVINQKGRNTGTRIARLQQTVVAFPHSVFMTTGRIENENVATKQRCGGQNFAVGGVHLFGAHSAVVQVHRRIHVKVVGEFVAFISGNVIGNSCANFQMMRLNAQYGHG